MLLRVKSKEMSASNALPPGVAAHSYTIPEPQGQEDHESEISLGYLASSKQPELQNQTPVSNFCFLKCFITRDKKVVSLKPTTASVRLMALVPELSIKQHTWTLYSSVADRPVFRSVPPKSLFLTFWFKILSKT